MVSPPAPEPLVLRPSRKRLVTCILVVASVWCFIIVLLLITDNGMWIFSFLPMVISTVGLFIPVAFSAGLVGDTVVDAYGVTRRRGSSRDHVPWEQVTRISFKAGGFGAGYQPVLFRLSGRPILLAAPPAGVFTSKRELAARLEPLYARAGRHRLRMAARPVAPGSRVAMVVVNGLSMMMLGGFTVFALFLASPWTQAWWPGRDEASRLPDACSVIDPATITQLIPKAKPSGPDGSVRTSEDRWCSWGSDAPPPEMAVRLELPKRFTGTVGGASEQAHSHFRYQAADGCPSTVSGVGDEACLGIEREPDGSTRAQVVARRGNVLVTVSYRASRPTEQVTAETIRLTRDAINTIHFN